MKNKGFTLIELLAVIVILAVVAIIAIPLIMNVIETSKKGAIKDSAYGLISASEAYVANNLRHGLENNVKFTCSNNKCVSDDNKEISFKGKVSAGTLIISTTNKVLVCVDDGEYYAVKLENEEKVTNGKGTCGAYEEAYGTFEIISDIDALKAKYEAEIKQLKEDYEAQIDYMIEHEKKVVKLGSSNGAGSVSFDCKDYEGWEDFTTDNFIVRVEKLYRYNYAPSGENRKWTWWLTPSLSYANGTVTVGNLTATNKMNGYTNIFTDTLYIDVYLIY